VAVRNAREEDKALYSALIDIEMYYSG
jgi:hypothetical protein